MSELTQLELDKEAEEAEDNRDECDTCGRSVKDCRCLDDYDEERKIS